MKNAPVKNGLSQAKTAASSWLEMVRQQVDSLRFGVVQIVVHESRVVQIERTEKVRFEHKPSEVFQQPTKVYGGNSNQTGQSTGQPEVTPHEKDNLK